MVFARGKVRRANDYQNLLCLRDPLRYQGHHDKRTYSFRDGGIPRSLALQLLPNSSSAFLARDS
jgi:hypothetical protein